MFGGTIGRSVPGTGRPAIGAPPTLLPMQTSRDITPLRRAALVVASAVAAAGLSACKTATTDPHHRAHAGVRRAAPAVPTTVPDPTTTSAPSTHGPITSPPLPAPGPGFVAGHVTVVGDSVMLDYQTDLDWDLPGADVQASVGRQWTTGQTLLQQAKASGQLGAVVVVGLGTNGPITTAQFDAIMSVLAGASRVVFVNVVVDRPWQDPNNAVLAAGVRRYPNAVLADWYTLATQNPGWLYSTGTHLPIGGTGAQALAAMVAKDA